MLNMELLRPCLFIYLLAILLSLSISSTTNSDHNHTNEWKGGDGAKLSRVRRQNLHLPEKSYALYIFWRLLNEVSNQTNTIRTSTEGPNNTEIVFKAKDKPSSAPTQKPITHSTGITGTNNSTVMASFPTDQSPPDSQKTTESGDSRLLKQSTQGLQTTIQQMAEPSQVTDLIQKPDSTKFKITSKAVEEPSSDTMHEETTRSTGANDSTAITSFPTERSQQESQKSTQSGAPRLFTQQSTQHLQHSKQETSEPSQVTEQNIPDSTTGSIKISSKVAKEPSSTSIHEKNYNFIGITDTKESTDMASFPTHPTDSQKTTQSGDSQLAKQLTTAKQKITDPSKVTEQHVPHSKTFTSKISSEAVEEPTLDIMHEETTRSTGANDSTAITSFPTERPQQESQKSTQSGAPRLFTQQSTQHLQHSKQETSEPSQITEQNIPDSTTVSIKISSKVAKEPSSTSIHEKNYNFIGITDTKESTDMVSFPTHPTDSQKTTQSGDSQLAKQLTTAKQKITEPSKVTEQHVPHSKTFTSKISSEAVEEPTLDIMHEETTRSTGANDSTAITSFPTERPQQESQKSTQSGAPRLFTQQSTQHLQHSKQETSEPSQVTEQNIPDSTKVSIKISSKAVEEPSSTIIHEQNDHFIGITNTKDSTDMASFSTHPTDSQKTTQSGDSQLAKQLTTAKQKITEPSKVTEQHILDSTTVSIKISSKAAEEPSSTTIYDEIAITTDSTAILSFHTDLPSQESQKSTQSGVPRVLKQSTHKILKPSEEILQPTALISTPDMATTYINEKETPLQTAINSRITNHGILASTRVNQNLQPTSLPQTMKNEHRLRVITGMVNDISKPTLPARTKNPPLSSSKVKLEILETATYTHSVTWYNGKPNQFVTATDRRILKPTLPTFTLKQQDATSLLLTVESPISHLNGFTSAPERSKPTPAKEPTNQHTEQNANNTEKSSRDSLKQHFMTTKTHILTNDSSVSSKTASTSHLPGLTEDRLVDSGGPGDTSVPTGVSLHVSTSSAAPFWTIQNQMNPKTQSHSTTNKYPILGTITSHVSVILVKDTSTQAPIDRVRSTQTIPVSTEKLPMTFTPKPSEKDTSTTSVTGPGTQKIPSWISTKWSNLQSKETEPQSGLTNQEPTADITAAKENYTKNHLLPEMDKPTQSTIGHKRSKMTHTATTKLLKTRKVSHNPKKFILPTHKSTDTAIKDDAQSDRGIFGFLFTLGCLILLIIAILLWVVWRRWHWRNNTWVAGSPSVLGIYSVWQSSSPHTAIDMKKRNTQKNEQEHINVYESVALMQQLKDFY